MRRNEPPAVARADRPRGLHGLLVVNLLLLLLLGAVTFGRSADAQRRPRGTYTMAAGDVAGWPSSAVYIVDTLNRELIAVTYEPSQKELIGVGFRSLASDMSNLARGGTSR